MPTYERALSTGEQRQLNQYAAIGNLMIGGERDASPTRIVTAIQAFVERHQRKGAGLSTARREDEEKPANAQSARALATVWGDQFVRVFGWEWVCIAFDGEEHHAVVQPDRSLAIFAAEYIEACLDLQIMDCAVKAVFDQLRANAIPPQQAWRYTSVLRWVHPDGNNESESTMPAHANRQAADRLASFIQTCGASSPPTDVAQRKPADPASMQISAS